MGGRGVEFLEQSFLGLRMQTLKDFEIVISDHSKDDNIKNFCESVAKESSMDINYFRNTSGRGSSSANINNAIKCAIGEVIKILFQDDYLCDIDCLKVIYERFNKPQVNWLVTGTVHTSDKVDFFNPMIPKYNSNIYLGNNTISSPSVLAVRNKDVLEFDESLSWLMDVDYYKRLFDKYGLPEIIERILVVNRLWDGQISTTQITQDIIDKEVAYTREKYS
jgi:glycosyltransferase involved in cell wall biosynthesis